MRFYKSTHCSLMLTTGLGVNAVCQSLGTCQQLLCVSVQRTFRYFFKLCGISFVVGFWYIWETVCMYVCERVWKLRCIFEWSWTKLLLRLLSGCLILTQRCLKSDLPSHKTKSVSTAAVCLCFVRASCVFGDIFVAPYSSFQFWGIKQHVPWTV